LQVPFVGVAPLRRREVPPVQAAASEILSGVSYHAKERFISFVNAAHRDFGVMMAPHHQGAIDMAQAELRYGHDEQFLRIAQDLKP
jgi:uncharacterized protein (DUF305 family)